MPDLLPIWVLVLVAALAFTVGFSVNRSGTCLVSAAHEVLYKRRAWRVGGLALAAMASSGLLLPLPWMSSPTLVALQLNMRPRKRFDFKMPRRNDRPSDARRHGYAA